MNGKLVIRVGGGFMVIEEFIAAYAEQEMKKIQLMEANNMFSGDGDTSGKNRNSGYSTNKKSPRASGGSPKADLLRKR
jgi:hypothetical protein